LDPDQPKPLYVPAVNTEAQLKKLGKLGKPAIEVATDYIGALYRYAMQKIESKYPKSYLDMLDRRFVLSVPAVWSNKAKDATLRVSLPYTCPETSCINPYCRQPVMLVLIL
jgi:hypothetical protein